MTTARQSQGAMRIVRRHPRAGGFLLAVVGVVMAWQSVQSGKEMSRFAGGELVDGRVVSVENVGAGLPDFRMKVVWADSNGAERTATTKVFKSDFEGSRPGDVVQLLVANDDPGAVALKRIYDNEGLVSLGFVQATPLVFAGVLVLLGGLFLLATGNRFLRPAE
jgi:hypothetical protein